eukprot:1340988-Rhodomonas_salina.1
MPAARANGGSGCGGRTRKLAGGADGSGVERESARRDEQTRCKTRSPSCERWPTTATPRLSSRLRDTATYTIMIIAMMMSCMTTASVRAIRRSTRSQDSRSPRAIAALPSLSTARTQRIVSDPLAAKPARPVAESRKPGLRPETCAREQEWPSRTFRTTTAPRQRGFESLVSVPAEAECVCAASVLAYTGTACVLFVCWGCARTCATPSVLVYYSVSVRLKNASMRFGSCAMVLVLVRLFTSVLKARNPRYF